MKKAIPNYWSKDGSIINNIEKKLSPQDKKTLEDYLRTRRTTAGDKKVQAYKTILMILKDLAEVPLSKFNDTELIDNLLILIKNSTRERAGKNRLRKVLKHFLKWKFKNLSLIENIKLEKDWNEKKFNANQLVTPEEMEKLIRAAAKNLKQVSMICLQTELGLRPSELLNLKWKDIKFFENHGEVEIFANKTNQVRTLPFKASLVHILRWKENFEYPNRTQDDFIFPSSKNRAEQLQDKYLNQLYKRICRSLKMRSINPYLIRHSVLSSVYKKTQDSRLTAKFGGHSLKTSEVYVQLNNNDIKDIVLEKLFNIKEPTIEEKNKMQIEINEMKANFKKQIQEIRLEIKEKMEAIENPIIIKEKIK